MKISKIRSLIVFLFTALIFTVSTLSQAWGQETKPDSFQEAQKWFEMANGQVQKKDFKGAIINYQKAIKSNPLLPGVHYNLANVYVQTGAIQKGVEEYKAAIKINPMIPDYHRNLGYAYALQKKGDLAKKKYEDLKKLDPAKADMLMEWINAGKK